MKKNLKNPITINRVDHVVIVVSSLSKSSNFYCEVLGLWIERWREDIGLAQLRAGRSMVDLQLEKGRKSNTTKNAISKRRIKPGQNMHHFALNLATFDEKKIRRHLKNYGVCASKTRTLYGADGLGKAIDVLDPDGNTVELKGPPTKRQKQDGRNERDRAKRRSLGN